MSKKVLLVVAAVFMSVSLAFAADPLGFPEKYPWISGLVALHGLPPGGWKRLEITLPVYPLIIYAIRIFPTVFPTSEANI